MKLEGTPSENLPEVLALGGTNAGFAFISLSGRHPEGRDAEYIAWHSLDHRPEQYRLPQLRHSIRLVSTPACRAARAASIDSYDGVDHVMTYMFTDAGGIPGFNILGAELDAAGRMPIRLPSQGYLTGDLAGTAAAPRAVAGADIIPWRAATGIYLLIEQGHASPASLIDVPGIAGTWWYRGGKPPEPFDRDATGLQVSYLSLDADPVATAEALKPSLASRWASGAVTGLLAAPFFAVVPFDWDRYLPTD